MRRTAFVTGATGFLGLNLVSALVREGWRVTALHRQSSDLTYLRRFGATLRVGTVEDYDSVLAAMPEGVDAVFHTAASVSWWRRNLEGQHRTNVLGTHNVAKAALARRARRFVHTSSVAAFGLSRDGSPRRVTESTPSTAPGSKVGYVHTKYLAELEVDGAIGQGLNAVLLNPANIVGPYDANNWGRSIRMVNEQKVPGVPPGGGSFCHVGQVVAAHLAAVEKGGVGERYLLGGADASYLEMFRIIGQLVGRKVPERPLSAFLTKMAARAYDFGALFTGKEPDLTYDMAVYLCSELYCSSDKAARELGYQPAQQLETMLADCHRWLVGENLLGG